MAAAQLIPKHEGMKTLVNNMDWSKTAIGVQETWPAALRMQVDFLLANRGDYETAYRDFRWPELDRFNWALDYFDSMARGNDKPALLIVEEDGSRQELSFRQLSERSNQVANFLRAQGLKRGDHLLLLLGNVVPLWETMLVPPAGSVSIIGLARMS